MKKYMILGLLVLAGCSNGVEEEKDTTQKGNIETQEEANSNSTSQADAPVLETEAVATSTETTDSSTEQILADGQKAYKFMMSFEVAYQDFSVLESTFRKNALVNDSDVDLQVAEAGAEIQRQLISLEPVDLQNKEYEKVVNDYYYYLIDCYGGLIDTSYSSYKRETDPSYSYEEHQKIADNFTLLSRELPSYRDKVVNYHNSKQ